MGCPQGIALDPAARLRRVVPDAAVEAMSLRAQRAALSALLEGLPSDSPVYCSSTTMASIGHRSATSRSRWSEEAAPGRAMACA